MKIYKKEKHWHLQIGKRHIKGPKLWDVLKCFVGLKSIMILLVLSSCGSIAINGIRVNNIQRKQFTQKDILVTAGCIAVGCYIGNNVVSKQK